MYSHPNKINTIPTQSELQSLRASADPSTIELTEYTKNVKGGPVAMKLDTEGPGKPGPPGSGS
jgi:hypothetical protein